MYDMIDYEDIAKKFAQTQGCDAIRYAGNRDGYEYYHIFMTSSIGHKTGMPEFVKISKNGTSILVNNLSERMWALNQEVLLNNL